MSTPTRALLLAALVLGSSLFIFSPQAEAQTTPVAFSMTFSDASVKLDVRPGASGVGCTSLQVSNEGAANIDVDVQISGGGVTISPSAVSVTLAAGASITVPVCAIASVRAGYKNVDVQATGQGSETTTHLNPQTKYAGFTAQIEQYARLSIRADQPFQRVGPGKEFPLTFTVLNYGNHVDTILVEVVNQESLEEAGFIVALSQPQIEIDSQGEMQVPLQVRTPRGTAIGWFNEYHTVIVKASTMLAGETEARSITATLWVRGVFLPGFESGFSMLALALVATALARMKRNDE